MPFFFASALFPISAMPGVLMAIATAMPLTHALALLRYGLVDPFVQGPHEIWVLAAFAVALTALSVRGRSVGQLRCLFAS